MISKRTLLILSVPGFALVWGFFMFRKRKSSDGSKKSDDKMEKAKFLTKPTHSECVNIIKPTENIGNKYGKSAPININTKMSYKNSATIEVTSDEENSMSLLRPSCFPDSVSSKNIFKNEKCIASDAIIVKALPHLNTLPEFEVFQDSEKPRCFIKSNKNCNLQNKKVLQYLTTQKSGLSPDSGKGSSLPHSESQTNIVTYEFILPTSLVGQLYGRKRIFINQIKYQTGANISVKKHPISEKIKICVVSGSENEVNSALCLIRTRLPVKRYPNLTLQRIHVVSPQTIVPLSAEHSQSLQMYLIEGINNDVIISSVVNGGHIFVRQPLHPTHPFLIVLQNCLNNVYNNSDTPMLPEITKNAICVGRVDNNWYRLQIIENTENNSCLAKFVDFGNFIELNNCNLRQIRTDFMSIPFQAVECTLSNIEPIGKEWCEQSSSLILALTKDIVLQAQIAGYTNENVPEIYLYSNLGANNIVFINKELVARKLAKWVEK